MPQLRGNEPILGLNMTCDIFQRIGKPYKRGEMSLVPQVTLKDFNKSVVDFLGPINPPTKRSGSRYIIIATYFLTIWDEEEQVRDYSAKTIAQLLFENVVTRFGCPRILMSD
jgi:hypothetical protein